MFGFHAPELIIILVVALLIFGPKKLPEMGSAIGKSIKEFRKGVNELSQSKQEETPKTPTTEAIDRESTLRQQNLNLNSAVAEKETVGTPLSNELKSVD